MLPFEDKRLTLPSGGSGQNLQVGGGAASLRNRPAHEATQVSQVLHGETLLLHHQDGEFGLIQNWADGYVGWVSMGALSDTVIEPTHRIKAARVHSYVEPAITAASRLVLGVGARLTATGQKDGRYIEFERAGWIVDQLVAPMDDLESDPAGVAERFLGTPYLWGGRDCSGLDCSGLVQIAFDACGIACPRDSDMQREWFGEAITDWQRPGALKRNDLIGWNGHIGIMLDAETLLHANGTFMQAMKEPLAPAIERIATEYGEPLGARRIDLDKLSGALPGWLTAPA